ncbi:MAG: AraC family transcriptional regulator [Oscillospiraceae bacterium]|nr:AraC family transcriptional regulator [Oscillospiraceae bacterium]
MDWLKGMNDVIRHIEENLTQPIRYESLSRIVGCSVYEFSRIFSFMAGMSVSEYIRRRRLSQAAFDIKNDSEKIIDIALKYCYESPTTFTRAFKELHGTAPLAARKTSVSLKTYPPISFILTVKGVNELKHRIEKRDCMALEHKSLIKIDVKDAKSNELGITIFNAAHWVPFLAQSVKSKADSEPEFLAKMKERARIDGYDEDNWEEWHANGLGNVGLIEYDVSEEGHSTMYLGRISDITDPQAIEAQSTKNATVIGNFLTKIPAATWAVFVFETELNQQTLSEAYTRILTEWMPISGYKRDVSVPHMEQYDTRGDNTWEIWMPVLKA